MNLSSYAKSVTSVATSIVAWGTETAALLELVPDKRTAGIISGILLVVHVVQSFLVWFTKNETVIEADVAALQKIVAVFADWGGTFEELRALLRQFMPAVPGAPPAASADPPADRHV